MGETDGGKLGLVLMGETMLSITKQRCWSDFEEIPHIQG